MNNGVNDTNNVNVQNGGVVPPTNVQTLDATTAATVVPQQTPAVVPVATQVVTQAVPVTQVVQPVVAAPQVAPVVATEPVVEPTTVAQEAVEPIFAPVEQNIPGVIVAPPEDGGKAAPKPIQQLEVETEAVTEPVGEDKPVVEEAPKKKKKSHFFVKLLLLIIVGLGGYIYWTDMQHKALISKMEYECTPVNATGEKSLELDSTLVQDLYGKVRTTLREDLALFDLNDQLKLYLAFRNIPTGKFYESNCNLFSETAMEPFTCKADFTPLAFKEEDLKLEVKKLFGDDVELPLTNINLGNGSCLGGYQYIPDRGEFVQGYCGSRNSTSYKMEKELIGAYSKEAYITLKEKVRYIGAEGNTVPAHLRSGTYIYTFKLDMNYNYIFVSKEIEQK